MDGIIIVDKPQGCTSHDIVRKVKKALNEKVGHAGTLDPMATGVLPLLIGKGTLCSKYLINHDKIYKVVLQLGKKTDTADSEGKVIEEKLIKEKYFDTKNVKDVLSSFIGEIKQTPPIYSAIKVRGKKLYEYARKGEIVEIPSRNVKIYSIDKVEINEIEKQISFEVSCSKGTYIRTLCEDIAGKMETVGYMKELRRIKVGSFDISNAINVTNLENLNTDNELVNKHFISVEKLFEASSEIILNDKKLGLFLNGVKLNIKQHDGIYRIYHDKKFIGIGIVEHKLLKRDIILDLYQLGTG